MAGVALQPPFFRRRIRHEVRLIRLVVEYLLGGDDLFAEKFQMLLRRAESLR
jgi:hypothetical protein